MSAADLLAELRRGLAPGQTSGSFDAGAVQDGRYVALLARYGIPMRLALTSAAGWTQVNDDVVLTATLTTPVFGVANAPVHVRFTPAGSGWTLLIDVQLPASWTFAQSFPALAYGAVGEVGLDPKRPSALIVASAATVDPLRTTGNAPLSVGEGLTLCGSLATGTGGLQRVAWLLPGTAAPAVSGPVVYDAQRGAVDMSIEVAAGRIEDLFGPSGPTLALDVALWSGLDTATRSYLSGIRLQTTLRFGPDEHDGSPLQLTALLTGVDDGLLELTASGGDIGLPAPATLARFFGASNEIVAALPDPFAGANLVQVRGVTFAVGLVSHSLEYAALAVGTPSGQIWRLWPRVIELTDAQFTFLVFAPLDPPATRYRFTFSAQVTLGNVPLLIEGTLPAVTLAASLDPASPRPDLVPLVEHIFGAALGLPEELWIEQLGLWVDVEQRYYSADLAVAGNWSFAFGTDNALIFQAVRMTLEYSADGGPAGEFALRFAIARNVFDVTFAMARDRTVLRGEWRHSGTPLDYQDIAIALGLYGLPSAPDSVDLSLREATFVFDSDGPTLVGTLETVSFGGAALVAGKDPGGEWGFVYGMVLSLSISLDLTDIDVVGKLVPDGADVLSISNLRVVGASGVIPPYESTPALEAVIGPVVSSGLAISLSLKLGTILEHVVAVRFGGANDGSGYDTPPGIELAAPAPPVGRPLAATATGAHATPAPQATWLAVQRAFGPVQFDRIGLAITPDSELAILLDASVTLDGLTIALIGLGATMPVRAPFKPGFTLAGLDVHWGGGGVTIAGGLERVPTSDPPEYTGELTVELPGFGLSVLGSYTTVGGEPSLFAFLFLAAPLGGPACFFVTGLAGGLGYNRTLKLPAIEDVETYPLVAAAMGQLDATTTETQLDALISPAQGEYWLAAGVRFTSYELVRSFALITARFGTQLELALLGESTISLPAAAPGQTVKPTAQADMVLLVDIAPSNGLLSVSAQLGPRSYVLSEAAKLTGGFAFYVWFAPSAHAGDFVVTLGGYNRYFDVPAHYPVVPRLGLNWKLPDHLTIKGGLYFALTPAAIMAGGELEASWRSGDVHAWFDARADFLIAFKPFHYLAHIQVNIGVSLKVDLVFTTKRITVHVGVSLTLWGPQFGGKAKIDLSVISFTLDFGASRPHASGHIEWAEFRDSFLPAGEREQLQPVDVAAVIEPSADATSTDAIVTIAAAAGLLGTSGTGEASIWLVDPATLVVSVRLQIPATDAQVITTTSAPPSGSWNRAVGVGPMGVEAGALASPVKVRIERDGVADDDTWNGVAITGDVPRGLWLDTKPGLHSDGLLKGVLTEIRLVPKPREPDQTLPVPLAELLTDDPPERDFGWSPAKPPAGDDFDQANAMATLRTTLVDTAVARSRSAVLAALRAQGFATASAVGVAQFAAVAPDVLASAPSLRRLGEQPA